MILTQYNHFVPATKTITEGEEIKDAYIIVTDGGVILGDYTDKSLDIESIYEACKTGVIDYLAATILITTACISAGFEALTANKKDIVGKFIATNSINLIAHYETLGMTTEQATGFHALRRLEHAENNALACNDRYNNKAAGWFPIILTYFSEDIALQIMKSASDYLYNYRELAQFGTLWGDSEPGILDYINDSGSVITSLTDYTLISGVDYAPVQSKLTKYFFA